jgi:hypothetical protein
MSADTNAKLRTPSPTPAAVRMRRYRKERRMGLRCWPRVTHNGGDPMVGLNSRYA